MKMQRIELSHLVLIATCVCFAHSRHVDSARPKRTLVDVCDSVDAFFQSRNIQQHPAQPASPKGTICAGQCCDAATEATLRQKGQEVFAGMLRHTSHTWQGLLNSTATSFEDHIFTLTRKSENKTVEFFRKVFQGYNSDVAPEAIRVLFEDIRRSVRPSSSGYRDTAPDAIGASVSRFFVDIFALMYQRIGGAAERDFTPEYKQCLRETFAKIAPFGGIPAQMAHSLSKSLDAARLLLEALNVGVEVLNATDTLIIEENGRSSAACHDALLKMTYCPKCIGLAGDSKPCAGYCMNVMRGCLTKYVVELDSPWNGYIEGVERLVIAMKQLNNEAGVNADDVIKTMHTRFSDAIILALETEKDIDTKVKRACGAVKLSDRLIPTQPPTKSPHEKQAATLSSKQYFASPENLMFQFLMSILKSRGFYSTLADNLCEDESFAEPKDEHCWNGERIGGYTKPVVDASLDTQKYNPEVKPEFQQMDARVINLADKLRHVHQTVMSLLGAVSMPESDSFMQGDATDGSGSGGGSDMDEEEESVRGSGSGSGPDYGKDPIITETKGNDIEGDSTKTSAAWQHLPLIFLLAALPSFLICA